MHALPSFLLEMRDMRPPFIRPVLLIAALGAVLAACSRGEGGAGDSVAPAAVAPAAPNVLEISATEFAFEAPDTIPSGATTIRLRSSGQELHHVQLLRLAEGKTYDDLLKESKGGPPRWALPVGGPNAPIPGSAVSETSLMLEPGNYAITCEIPSSDGKPHIMKGMSRALVVTPSTATAAALPEADFTVTLSDYAFAIPDSIGAGKHMMRVENAAEQPHEILIVKLNDGASPADLVKWVEKMEGPPPAAPFGGTTAIAKGGVNVVALDLPPGDYGLLCFIPDANDGKMHVEHGMLRRLKVG